MTRRRSFRLAIALLFAIASLANTSPGKSVTSWYVKNTCYLPGNSYFYAFGPASGWVIHTYSGSPAGCHLVGTTHVGDNPINYAAWYLPVSTAYDATYYADAFMPCDSHRATYIRYQTLPMGTANGVYNTLGTNQNSTCNLFWVLINRTFWGSHGGYMRIVDTAFSTGGGQKFSVDAFLYT